MRQLILIVLLTFLVSSQGSADDRSTVFQTIDEHVLALGPMHGQTLTEIAERIVAPAATDTEKARALYRWITEHIAYDVEQFSQALDGAVLTSVGIDDILQTRQSVCNGYARLYQAMGWHVGLDVKIVAGYGEGWSAVNRDEQEVENHAWNAVRLNGRWQLLDTTWGAGYATPDLVYVKSFDPDYFLADPVVFAERHKPSNPIWTLLDSDTFLAPAIERPANERLGARLLAPTFQDVRAEVGETVRVRYAGDPDLALSAWIENMDPRSDLEARPTLVLPEYENGEVIYEMRFPAPGRYRLKTGARPSTETGLYDLVYEHTILVEGRALPQAGILVGGGLRLIGPQMEAVSAGQKDLVQFQFADDPALEIAGWLEPLNADGEINGRVEFMRPVKASGLQTFALHGIGAGRYQLKIGIRRVGQTGPMTVVFSPKISIGN